MRCIEQGNRSIMCRFIIIKADRFLSFYLFLALYNNFTMKKNDPKFRRFMNLQGYLQKLSSNFLVGYQMKFWRVLQEGTKIGYSNQRDQQIKPENTFLVKECFASEASGNSIFELHTRDKVFLLKAPNQEDRIDWIKGITFLNKVAKNQIKIKPQPSPTQTTIASKSERIKNNKKTSKIQTTTSLVIERPRMYQPQDLGSAKDTQSQIISELVKFLPQKFLKYNTLITHLKVKSQGIFMNSFDSNTYLMISPKSLYPDIYIGDDNLSNLSLPPWLEINIFYKILNNKQKKKQIFNVTKILDIREGSENYSIKVNTGQIIYQFFAETLEQKQCLKNCLQIASVNAQEVIVNGKMSKRNFDKLIDLHETRIQQFEQEAQKIVCSFLKDPNQYKYSPKSLCEFMDSSMAYLRQFVEVLEKKKKNKDHVIQDMLKLFHEQVKTQAKLTWDSSFMSIKGVDILNILKKLSQYYQMMKNFIKSAEFLQGMKELSKIYVRESWKNFQSIIINIVQQQKTAKVFFQDQQGTFVQTHGVTDLFKFIYSVFDLAYPHWKNKIHLHNVNRLLQRALQVFINQIRSTIDEQFIPQKQMIGLANNYFHFSDCVRNFYGQKFKQQLAEKTQQSYEKIVSNYRQVSIIILEKIASNIGYLIEQQCLRNTIQTIKCEAIEQIVVKAASPIQKMLHMAFKIKLYEKIIKQIHIKLSLLVFEQVKTKKKLKLKQIVRCVKQLRTSLTKFFQGISKSNTSMIDKKMTELQIVLSYDLYSDIQQIMIHTSDPIRGIYSRVMELREDYYEGSALYGIVNHSTTKQQQPQIKRTNTKLLRKGSIDIVRQKNGTLSGQYFKEEFNGSDDQTDEEKDIMQNRIQSKIPQIQNKLISEGYLTKGKRNHKAWEKQYFRLKNQFLYVFQSADSQRCRNAIEIKNIVAVDVSNPQKPSFLLTYKNLGKQKQIKLKADTIELRQRWVASIELQRKRLLNEEQVKKKSIKFRQTASNTGKKKYQMIIDYWQLEKGKDYFSYSG